MTDKRAATKDILCKEDWLSLLDTRLTSNFGLKLEDLSGEFLLTAESFYERGHSVWVAFDYLHDLLEVDHPQLTRDI